MFFVPIKVNKTTKTGVEHGLENNPDNTPIMNAALFPFFLYFSTKLIDGKMFITSNNCKAIKIHIADSTKYHHSPAKISTTLNKLANIPSKTNVSVLPKQKRIDVFKVSFLFTETKPIINGTVDKLHGVNEVIIPANNANRGANKMCVFIASPNKSIKLFIKFIPHFFESFVNLVFT